MLDKSIALGLMGIVASITTTDIAENSEYIIEETTTIAVVVQEHELETALELYYLKNNHYPKVTDQALVLELQKAGVLKNKSFSYEVEYATSNNGQRFTLALE